MDKIKGYQLCYIVAGSFNLDLTWIPFPNCLKNKLSWAQILASKNGVSFSVSDHTIASEFGQMDVETGHAESPEGLLRLQRDAVLHIDVCRIDQVIRNLIVNAVKLIIIIILIYPFK